MSVTAPHAVGEMEVGDLEERVNRLECMLVGAKDAKRKLAGDKGDTERKLGADLTARIRNLTASLQPLGPVTDSTAYALAGQGLLPKEQETTAVEQLLSRADDAMAMARELQELKALEDALLQAPLPNLDEAASCAQNLRPLALQQEEEVLASDQRLQLFIQTYSAAVEAISSKFVELDARLRRLETST